MVREGGRESNYFDADQPSLSIKKSTTCTDEFNQHLQGINLSDVFLTLDGWVDHYDFHDDDTRRIVPKHEPF